MPDDTPATPARTETAHPRAVKAVIPAAGLATRFLPATKAVPKELLPLVDRPVLQYIVSEAAAAGIRDVLIVTGRGKTSMVDHFDRQPYLEERLAAKGDFERLAAVREPAELAEIYTCRQAEPLGLGHAVGCAESHVSGQPFAVLLGDEFCAEDQPVLPAMIDLQARTGGIVVELIEAPGDEIARYGAVAMEPTDVPDTLRITGMVEKPAPHEAPSHFAIVGRYVLPPGIFDAIRRTKPGNGGEIQLTDAMALMLEEGAPVHGIVYHGTRYDTGVPLGYLQAVVQIASARPDLGAEFLSWLREFVAGAGGPSATAGGRGG